MDFADEHYVKLFSRDTVTWRSWPWQSRALFPLLMRAVDHAGILSVGTREPSRSVALMVNIPDEVVKPGLEALLKDGTVELVAGSLIVPRFVDAQESRKTNAQAKREQREKAKALARAPQLLGETVGRRQTAADGGRSGHPPSPALLDPVPKKPAPRNKRASPADPRHAPMVKALMEAFLVITGAPYPFKPRDARHVTEVLALGNDAVVLSAWKRALRSTGFPKVRTLGELVTSFAHFVGLAGSDPNDGIMRGEVKHVEHVAAAEIEAGFGEYVGAQVLAGCDVELSPSGAVVRTRAGGLSAGWLREQLAVGARVTIVEHETRASA